MPDYLRINVNNDVELEIILFLGFALYPDVEPFTARFKAESRAIHCDVHASSSHLKGNKL